MKLNKMIIPCLSLLCAIGIAGCKNSSSEKEEVKIVYTNDIHSYIGNEETDSSGKTVNGLRVSNVAQMVKDMRNEGQNVLFVDDGDEVQGSVFGSYDNGKSVIDIMNAAGYDLATPGNHDFDFGMEQFNTNVANASFPYISCNFKSSTSGNNVLDSTKIFEIGGVKIAFVGISTPETITSSTPKIFQDTNGNYIYSFDGQSNKEDLYNSVQSAINTVRGKADYVIGLGHLGVGSNEERDGIRSIDVINNTTGLDAFIDGHSHTVMEGDKIKRKDGKEIILTQTGCYMEACGVMTISKDGTISTKLESSYASQSDSVASIENTLISNVNEVMGEKIGYLDKKLYIYNPTNASQRIVRAMETNLGDFCADSTYWYFNEYKNLECDISISNGGGVRTDVEAGDLTYMSAKNVNPFGNMICMIEATGQQIKDALEMGATVAGTFDTSGNPSENGGFLHVAGMKYSIDGNVSSSVTTDSNGMFISVTGAYKVKDIEIYNKTTKAYEALDLTKTYKIAGTNYILRNSGNGCSMFASCSCVVDFTDQDYLILSDYIASFAKESDGYSHINNTNSPLKSYTNYLLDYENPYGAGRISVTNKSN